VQASLFVTSAALIAVVLKPPGLILEIDIRERLPVGVAHDKAGIVEFFDGPRRREAAGCHGLATHFCTAKAHPSLGVVVPPAGPM
jgi:hypothetical protein